MAYQQMSKPDKRAFWIVVIPTFAAFVVFMFYLWFGVWVPAGERIDERQTACENHSAFLAWVSIEADVIGTSRVEVAQQRNGCLITWPDGSTQLVDYEAYK